jgi:tetratricopeptide (TPR) repeat protein
MESGRNPASFFESARSVFRELLQAHPDFPDVYDLGGWLSVYSAHWLVKQGSSPEREIKNGLDIVKRLLTVSPDRAEGYWIRGALLLLRSGNAQDAEASFREALRLNPNLKFQIEWTRKSLENVARASLPATAATEGRPSS